MIFKTYTNVYTGGTLNLLVKEPSIKLADQTQSDSNISLTYLDGSTDNINFGTRKQVKTEFSVLTIFYSLI